MRSSDTTGYPRIDAGQARDAVLTDPQRWVGAMAGEYRIEYVLSRGGMATVYAARHPVIGKRAAVKVLAAQFSSDPRLVRRFIDEARAVNRICHPNIVDIFAFGQLQHGPHFLVMEQLEGETLATRLERERLPLELACLLLAQTADALAAAHRAGIVHRDLKPQNLFIVQARQAAPSMKVLDFGIAKLLEHSGDRQVSHAGAAIGTPHFMAPEQCLGERVDSRADVYALGVVLYRVFAGKLPFVGATFAEIVAQHVSALPSETSDLRALPGALWELIQACLEKAPAHRPRGCEEIAAHLRAVLESAAGPALAVADAQQRGFARRRWRALFGIAAAGLLGLSGGRTVPAESSRELQDAGALRLEADELAAASPALDAAAHERGSGDGAESTARVEPPSVQALDASEGTPMKREHRITPTHPAVQRARLIEENPF
jgi:serine/threonine protein kinase